MAWNVEHTDEFAEWYHGLSEAQQDDITAAGLLLIEQGHNCPFPIRQGLTDRSTLICVSCVCRAADDRCEYFTLSIPGGSAILLIGGDKTGDDRFYERMVPVADQLYDMYIAEIRKEGLIP